MNRYEHLQISNRVKYAVVINILNTIVTIDDDFGGMTHKELRDIVKKLSKAESTLHGRTMEILEDSHDEDS